MDGKLKQLYQDVILVHNKEPYHYEKKEDFPIKLQAYNPICGDKFELFLKVDNGIVSHAYFHGFGCAISKAATSLLSQIIEGKKLTEIDAILAAYLEMLEEGKINEQLLPAETEAFVAAKSFPGRKQCASLSWEELAKWIEQTAD